MLDWVILVASKTPSHSCCLLQYLPWCVPESNPLTIPPGPLYPALDNIFVSSLGDPHALGPEKVGRVSLGVPLVLVDAHQTVPRKVPKDPSASTPEEKSKTFTNRQLLLEDLPFHLDAFDQ